MTPLNPKAFAAVLEMAAFRKKRVYTTGVYPAGRCSEFMADVVDTEEDSILVEASGETADRYRQWNTASADHILHCKVPYQSGVFEFTSAVRTISEVSPDTIRVQIAMPSEWTFSNRRAVPRIVTSHCNDNIQMQVFGEFETNTVLSCERLLDISERAAAVTFSRSGAATVNNGTVEHVEIWSHGKEVFSALVRGFRTDVAFEENSGDGKRHILLFQPVTAPKVYKRRVRRVTPPARLPIYVEVEHPLVAGTMLHGRMENFSKLGMSFVINDAVVPVFRGMCFNRLILHLPFRRPFIVCAQVVHSEEITTPETGDVEGLRIGVVIENFSDLLNRETDFLYLGEIDMTLSDARPEDFEKLIDHLFQSRFIYHQKRQLLQENATEVLATQRSLLENRHIARTIVARDGEGICGCVQYLKYHDNVWLVQHLAGGSRGLPDTGKKAVAATIDYFLYPEVNRMLGVDYVICYYRPQNPFPMILFDGFTQQRAEKRISGSYRYTYCRPDLQRYQSHCGDVNQFQWGRADDKELRLLESVITDTLGEEYRNVEALSFNALKTNRVSDEYSCCGLTRERSVICMKNRQGTPLAFSVCEHFSHGINLSELTNSFKMYCVAPEYASHEMLCDTLACVTLAEYKWYGVSAPVLLVPSGFYIPKPFRDIKEYMLWYLDAAYFGELKHYFHEITADFRKYLRAFKNSTRR